MCAVSFVLVAAATTIDRRLAQWVHESQAHDWTETLPARLIKSLGVYYCLTTTAALIVLWRHRYKTRAALFVLFIGVVCLMGNVMKWIIGRSRPFRFEPHHEMAMPFTLRPFHDGWGGLITQTNLAFPSGHTMVAFATAASLAILWPRWRWVFYSAAALVAIERILENAHWLSDTIGAAGLAICGVHLMWRILRPWVIAEPLARIEAQPAASLSRS